MIASFIKKKSVLNLENIYCYRDLAAKCDSPVRGVAGDAIRGVKL